VHPHIGPITCPLCYWTQARHHVEQVEQINLSRNSLLMSLEFVLTLLVNCTPEVNCTVLTCLPAFDVTKTFRGMYGCSGVSGSSKSEIIQ
jgi:hypothetical protein